MDDRSRAKLAGLATNSMYEMIRDGQSFRLPSILSRFIAERSWEMVEYLSPETSQPAIAHFDNLVDWATASPARGGLGTRLDLLVKYITRPMDNEAAPECCQKLASALPDTEKRALLPMIAKAAKLNAEHTGDRRWLALLDEWDRANPSRQGERTDLKAKEDFVDNIHEVKERPTGTSAAAGLRKLRRYSSSAEVCAERGVDQAAVIEEYGRCLRGEKSVHRALIDCGLKPASKVKKSVWIGTTESMARRLLDALGRTKTAELVAVLTQLLTEEQEPDTEDED